MLLTSEFCRANAGLIVGGLKRFNIPLTDVSVSAGWWEFIKAARFYNPDRGRFSTCFYHRLRWLHVKLFNIGLREQRMQYRGELPDRGADDPELGRVDLVADVAAMLDAARLTDRQRFILHATFWHKRTLDDIGRELGISSQAASMARRQALDALRCAAHRERLREQRVG